MFLDKSGYLLLDNRTTMIKLQSLKEAKNTHNTNVLKSLERRLELARTKGQTALVAQLEAEKNYYLQ